jgi:formyl-CoA transferase
MAGDAPFAGITVLDLGQVYLGPYCTMLMSRLGAEVIKVEPPTGEPVRWRGAQVGVETSAFGLLNAGKRSLRLDLKQERGRDLLLRMAQDADVLVENFGPGTLDRLGLGWDVLSGRNPRLILASGRGYGADGPYRDFLAMDLTVQAMSGVMSTTGFADGPPLKAGPALADFLGGIHLFGAIAAALVQRATTGTGQRVEIAMHDAVLPSLASAFAGFLDSGGTLPSRTGNRHGAHAVAPYNVYPASDGWIAIIAMNDRHWQRICQVMGRPEHAEDPELLHHRERVAAIDRVDGIVAAWTRTLGRREAFELLRAAGIPAAPVVELAELFDDPQVRSQEMLLEVEGRDGERTWTFGNPIRMSAAPPAPVTPAPSLGADSDAILRAKLSLDDETIAQLRADGVI